MSSSPRDDWKQTVPATGAGQPARRRSRLLIALVPLLIAIGVAVGLFFYLRPEPKPHFLSLCVAEYDAWPVNAWAQQDGEGLKEHFPDGTLAFQSQEGDGLIRELDRLAERAAKESGKPSVIHICALGVVDGGEVSILPAKAVPGSPGTWLPLSRVLESVGKIRGSRLLILDVRPVAEPRLGQRGDELEKGLHDQLAAAERDGKLPYLVFAQCAPADYPFVSPELRRGVFAECLRRGLAGHADGWNDRNRKDDQVSAMELMAFTRARVAQWLAKHQSPAGLPVLHGKSDDFVLVSVPQRGATNEPVEETPPTSVKIGEAWARTDKWKNEGATHHVPRTYQHLQMATMRAHARWWGGAPGETVERELETALGRLEEQRKLLEPRPYPILSVGRNRRIGIAREPETTIEMQSLLDALKRPGAKADELKAKQQPFWDKPPEAAPYNAIASIVLRAIVDSNDLTPEQLRSYRETLRGLKPPPTHVELGLLEFFSESDVKFRTLWPAAMPRAALRAAIASNMAIAVDGRALTRIEKPLAEADADFRSALLALFQPNEAEWKMSLETFIALPASYESIGQLGGAYERALFEWDETTLLLAAIGGASSSDSLTADAIDTAWADVATKAKRLTGVLDMPSDADATGRTADDLRFAREKLVGLLRDIPAGAGPVEIRRRLRLPVWTAAERQSLMERSNAAALDLARQAMGESVPVAVDGLRTRSTADQAANADRRQKRAIDLAAIAGEQNVEPRDLRAALSMRLLERYRKAATPAERSRFVWLIHPNDLPTTPETTGAQRNDPAADARRDADKAFARWLAERRVRPLADELNKQQAEAAKTLARDLYETARRLNAWQP